MNDSNTCPRCGKPTLGFARTEQSVTAPDGTVLHYEDELTRCSSCGEEFYTPDQSLGASRMRAAALRAHAGLLTPAEIRGIREKYDLSQTDLEKALGFGPKTVVRWERGSVCQSSAANNLLVVARDFPAVFADLASRNGVELAGVASGPASASEQRGIVLQFHCAATIDRGSAPKPRKRYGRFRTLHRTACEQSTGNAAQGCFENARVKVGVA